MNPQEMDSRKENLIGQLATLYSRDQVDLETFEELVSQVHACTSPVEIDALVASRQDLLLPMAIPDRNTRSLGNTSEPMLIQASMSKMERSGRWVESERLRVEVHMSGVVLDFRDYEGDAGFQLDIEVQLQMSNLKVYVPSGWQVDTQDVNLNMSNIKNRPKDGYGKGSLHFSGVMGMSNIKIRYR